MQGMARLMIISGIILLAMGLLMYVGGRIGLGRLPGDIRITRATFTFYFPLATSIILSVILTIILNLFSRR